MPFRYISETCPLMNYDGFLCRNAEKPAWVEAAYPPKCNKAWDTAGNEPCIYGSGPIANDECGCIGYWAQYCTDDETGNRGRAWVVQFWCYDGDTGTATTSHVKVLDWECRCVGARFEYDLTIGGCCCECGAPDCDCLPPSPLYADVEYGAGTETATMESVDFLTWYGTTPAGCLGALRLFCVDGNWTMGITDALGFCTEELVAADSGTCDPFSLVFTFTPPECFGCSDGSITIRVTE